MRTSVAYHQEKRKIFVFQENILLELHLEAHPSLYTDFSKVKSLVWLKLWQVAKPNINTIKKPKLRDN